jgi:tetratricopeptide (TPR) repeat protein
VKGITIVLLAMVCRLAGAAPSGGGPDLLQQDGSLASLQQRLGKNSNDHQARLALGRLYLKEKKYQHALNEFSAVIKKDDKITEALTGRALALAGLQDLPKAILWAKKATAQDPDDIDAWHALGRIYLNESYLDAPRAEAVYEQILLLDPSDRQAKLQMAKALSYKKKVDQAIVLLESLAKEQPDDWHVQIKLAESYFAIRKLSKAEAVLESVLATHPGNASAKVVLEAVHHRQAFNLWVPLVVVFGIPLMYLLVRRFRRGKLVSDPEDRASKMMSR